LAPEISRAVIGLPGWFNPKTEVELAGASRRGQLRFFGFKDYRLFLALGQQKKTASGSGGAWRKAGLRLNVC
jgi:hypothetical protein